MSSFSPCSVLRRSSLEWPQFPDGHFPFAGVAQRRTSTITPGGSQPARFVPVGPGHDRHRRPDGCLLHHATRRTGAATLWVIFGEDRFHWDTSLIGISLAAFGILHSLAQQ